MTVKTRLGLVRYRSASRSPSLCRVRVSEASSVQSAAARQSEGLSVLSLDGGGRGIGWLDNTKDEAKCVRT